MAAGVLLTPYVYTSLDLLAANYRYTLICLPSTAYALWLLHRMQRYRRIPWRLLSWRCADGVR